MKKLSAQILLLASVVLVFTLFNLAVYNVFTYRCLDGSSNGMKAKSIELAAYLPFDEDSKAVRVSSALKLDGDLPVIDGAAALYPICSSTVDAIYPEGCVEFDGADFSDASALQMNNTRAAYRAIVDGETDIALLAAPSDEQLAYAKETGVELVFTPIGREAFVFLVNKKNPVDSLTCDEVRGIYSGKYHNWSELGGDDRLIGALVRNAGSGSQTALESFMGDTPIATDYDGFLGRAIGFSFRFYVEDVVRDGNVKMLALEGVYPSAENIANGTYPLVSEFYAVYRADNGNENIQKVLEWLLSEEGQAMIEATGYSRIK